jgi:imidazolonepropionase-like amidohydrolase
VLHGQDNSFFLRGGTVHTIAGPVIENGSIIVRDGKIIGVGKNLTPPAGMRVLDITGQHVYPGMIDSASMVGANSFEEPPVSAKHSIFNPQAVASNGVHPDSEQIPMARANGVTSVVVIPEGGLIPGQLSLIHLDSSTNEAMSILPAAAMYLQFPVIATTRVWEHEPKEDDEEPQTAVQRPSVPYAAANRKYNREMKELNSFFEKARSYRRAKLAKSKVPKLDPKYEAMIPVLDGSMPVFVTAVREREIREAIAFADKQKIEIVLADAAESYKVIDLIKASGISVVLQPTLTLPLNDDDPYDRNFTTPSDLYKAGIKFSIATFSANGVKNLPYQAAAAVPFGLPEDEAYKAVSLNAAEIFGVGKKLGSIEEGKMADLIVTTGDPLDAKTQVNQVFINGKLMDPETRQKQLYQQYRPRP